MRPINGLLYIGKIIGRKTAVYVLFCEVVVNQCARGTLLHSNRLRAEAFGSTIQKIKHKY